jgi:membrane protein CcdC involved in cytochrome C biogenesis
MYLNIVGMKKCAINSKEVKNNHVYLKSKMFEQQQILMGLLIFRMR